MKISECWLQVNGEASQEHFLIVNGVQVAVVQPNDDDIVEAGGRAWTIYAYDSDFQDMYSDKLEVPIPDFETLEEAKAAAESVFIEWLKRSFQELVYL